MRQTRTFKASLLGFVGVLLLSFLRLGASETLQKMYVSIAKQAAVMDSTAPTLRFVHPSVANLQDGDTLSVSCQNVPMLQANWVLAIDDTGDTLPISFQSFTSTTSNCAQDGYLSLIQGIWQAQDTSGNIGTLMIFIRVQDQTPPILNGIPADITVNIAAGDTIPAFPTGVNATDACGSTTIAYREVDSTTVCGHVLTRQWTALDFCGNVTSQSQILTIITNPACNTAAATDTFNLVLNATTPIDTCLTAILGANNIFTSLRHADSMVQTTSATLLSGTCLRLTPSVSFRSDRFEGLYCDTMGLNCRNFILNINLQGRNLTSCGLLSQPNPIRYNISNCNDSVFYCLNDSVDFDTFSVYFNILQNGAPITNSFSACRKDTLFSYTYFAVPGSVQTGAHRLDYWYKGTDTFRLASFSSIQTLVDSMNVWDIGGNWRLDTQSFVIVGGDKRRTYGQMRLTRLQDGSFGLLERNLAIFNKGVSVAVGSGLTTFYLQSNDGLCRDTLITSVDCSNRQLLPPVALNDRFSGAKNQIQGFKPTANDTLNGNLVSLGILNAPQNGNIGFVSVDSLTYTPNRDFCGTDTLRYVVCNDLFLCDTAAVYFSVVCPPDSNNIRPPLAVEDHAVTRLNQFVNINVLANDSLGLDTLRSVRILNTPTLGTAVIIQNQLRYTPDSSICGETDSLSYEICTQTGCDTALVTVQIVCDTTLTLPIAVLDTAATVQNRAVNIAVLANDTLNGTLIGGINVVNNPIRGIATVIGMQLIYQPETPFCNGNDTLSYAICNINGCDTANVIIRVSCDTTTTALRPVAVDDSARVLQNRFINIPILANDFINGVLARQIGIVRAPQKGAVGLFGNVLNYTPLRDSCGIRDTFQYEICNSIGCDTATVFIEIVCDSTLSDSLARVIAVNDTLSTRQNTALTFTPLSNDTLNAGFGGIQIVSAPVNGLVLFTSADSLIYTPDSGYCGIDTFSYAVCNTAFRCDTAQILITVSCDTAVQNLLPMALNDTATVSRGDSIRLAILANDTLNGNLVSISILTGPNIGLARLDTNNVLIYTAKSDTCGINDTLSYRICNATGCDTAQIVIRLSCDTTVNNLPPIAIFDTIATNKAMSVLISVLVNDTLRGADTFRLVRNPTQGVAVFDTLNRIRYTPDSTYCGRDTLVYEICNRFGCDTASVFINVLCTNVMELPPVTLNDTFAVFRNDTINVNILANDTLRGATTPEILTQPTRGIATITPENTLFYTPDREFCGRDSIQYRLCNNVGCDTAWIIINIDCRDNILVYNAFSPNDDGRNDRLQIRGIDQFPDNVIVVYNRWGNEVYRKKGYDNADGWDGTWDGKPLPDGTYYYHILLNDPVDKTRTIIGYIQIGR